MRRDLHKSFRIVAIAAALASALVGIPRPAAASEVHVEGSAVIFKAGNNEVNNVVVNARGAAFDPSTGQFVQGFTVSDSPTPATPGPGCRAFTGAVVCDVLTASFVALDLGDKGDTVRQQEGGEPGDAVPMRVKGGPGNDTLTGGSRADNLDGELGDDTIDGGNGNDVLVGGAGIDTITGGDGTDTISAGLGKDTINARDGQQDTINCGLGGDTLNADSSDTKKRCN